LGVGLPGGAVAVLSISSRVLDGDMGVAFSTLHTLACRVPILITLWPNQVTKLTLLHLLLECNLAEPFFGLIEYISIKASYVLPKVQSQRESRENATAETPKL